MARKNARISDNKTLGVVFDTRTKSVVMAQDTPQEGIREKVAAVNEVVPTRNKHEITLVLQHFYNDVPSTIQAFLDNGARDVLQEWQSTVATNKPTNKKKKKPQKSREEAENTAPSGVGMPQAERRRRETNGNSQSVSEKETSNLKRHGNSTDAYSIKAEKDRKSTDDLSSGTTTTTTQDPVINHSTTPSVPYNNTSLSPPPPDEPTASHTSSTTAGHTMAPQSNRPGSGSHKGAKNRPHNLDVSKARERTISEASNSSASGTRTQKPHAGLEKSLKDLQRQTISLQRQPTKLLEEIERARKQISNTFQQITDEVNTREAALLFQLNKVKHEAQEQLSRRQEQASLLRSRLDRAPSLNDVEVAELRADVKHFVSERKIDEELGGTKRFTCDLQQLQERIQEFGDVHGVKAPYTTRRPSASSIASSLLSPDDLLSPLSPPHSSKAITTATTHHTGALGSTHSNTVPLGAKVVSQSESLTQYEVHYKGNPNKDQRPSNTRHAPTGPRGPRAEDSNRTHNKPQRGPQGGTKSEGGQPKGPAAQAEDDAKKSRSARRRQKQRERQREQRQEQRNDGEKSSSRTPSPRKPQGTDDKQPQGTVNKQPDNDNKTRSASPRKSQRGSESEKPARTPSPRKRDGRGRIEVTSSSEKEAKSSVDRATPKQPVTTSTNGDLSVPEWDNAASDIKDSNKPVVNGYAHTECDSNMADINDNDKLVVNGVKKATASAKGIDETNEPLPQRKARNRNRGNATVTNGNAEEINGIGGESNGVTNGSLD